MSRASLVDNRAWSIIESVVGENPPRANPNMKVKFHSVVLKF